MKKLTTAELIELERKLESKNQQLRGGADQLIRQAERVEEQRGQPSARSKGYRTDARRILEGTETERQEIRNALGKLDQGDPTLALQLCERYNL